MTAGARWLFAWGFGLLFAWGCEGGRKGTVYENTPPKAHALTARTVTLAEPLTAPQTAQTGLAIQSRLNEISGLAGGVP